MARDSKGGTHFLNAAFDGNIKEVNRLISVAKSRNVLSQLINLPQFVGATPLFAASQEGHVEVVKTLISNGASIDQAVDNGPAPIYVASQKGHPDVVQNLLISGAENMFGAKKYTVLHIAAQKNHHDIIQLLIKDSKVRNLIDDTSNEYRDTPLTSAIQFAGDLEMVRLLVSAGANWKKKGDGKTPLQWAIEERKPRIVDYLRKL